ncbi:MAG: hypothetical protein HQL26_09180 [Candidatus Omnitrophica bacterium]|nr:hypothetical protein [Candidatus Omnitrophota bacterium]
MKNFLWILFLFIMFSISSSSAETLVLNSGKEVTGKIVSRTSETVVIENESGRNGVLGTQYLIIAWGSNF